MQTILNVLLFFFLYMMAYLHTYLSILPPPPSFLPNYFVMIRWLKVSNAALIMSCLLYADGEH